MTRPEQALDGRTLLAGERALGGDDLTTLDFMRALCTLVVVCSHYLGMTGHFPSVMGGLPRVAVLMFFVHTSFVLMLSLERQHAQSADKLWRRFMVRRLFRVYPLTIFVLAAIMVFRIPSQMVPPNFHYLHLGAGAVFANFLLAMNLTNSPPMLSPMWSLPYEIQLYLFLPALFLLVKRWRGPWPVFWLWCGTLALALMQPHIPKGGRLDILEFAPCFVAGILCFKLSKKIVPMMPFILWPLLLVPGLLLIFLYPPTATNWPVAWIACFLMAVTVPFIRQTTSRPLRRLSHWIAQYSFAIYLSHYFCLWLAFRANHLPWPAQWTIFIGSNTALPIALYRLIEQPMIRVGRMLSVDSLPVIAQPRRSPRRIAKRALVGAVEWMWKTCFQAASCLLPHTVVAWTSPGGQRVLIVAPHPDDEAIGCVGTVLLHVDRGDKVCVAIATDGRRFPATADPAEVAAQRRREATRAARHMQLDRLEWIGLPEGEWSAGSLKSALQELITETEPDIIYAPSRIDFHVEHRKVAHALALALGAIGNLKCRVRVYQVQVPLTTLFTNLVADVSSLVSRCDTVLGAYASQSSSLNCTYRQRGYSAKRFGIAAQAEEFWEIPVDRYLALHEPIPEERPPSFRGLRYWPFTDPLAYMTGRKERRKIRAEAP